MDVITASGQGVEHRRSFINALVAQGHDVTITSGCAPECIAQMRHRSLIGENWMNKLHFDLRADGSKFDIFILEAASQNTRFHRDIPIPKGSQPLYTLPTSGLCSPTGDTRPTHEHYWFIENNFRILNKFRGKVFLWHHIYTDNVIFPFSRKYHEPKPDAKSAEELSHLNWRNLFKNFDPFEGKEWTVMYHCLNEDFFKHTTDHSTYGSYADFPQLKYKYIHLPKSKLDPYYPTKENPTWDSLYIGSRYTHNTRYKDYDRLPNVKKFYDTPLYKAAVHGYFDGTDDFKFQYAANPHSHSNIVTATGYWNDSYSHIFTESATPSQSGSVTGRTFLSLNGGAILLLDKGISGMEKFGLPEYLVSDAEDVVSRISEIKSWTPAKRDQIRKEQLSVFPDWLDLQWSEILS